MKQEKTADGLKLREEKISIYDVTGIIEGNSEKPTNAVELKKKFSRGEKI